ncbi:MAG: SDR family oxidoreductase [Verrucomicrobia bacterium]|nr:SDR family oxidoreductase [Verrucomicrobiota bacterium]
MKDAIDQKLIVLTGATRGLGRALTMEMARLGHTVLGCGRSRAAVDDLRSKFTVPHDFATVDVIDDKGVRVWAQRLIKQHGAPDLLLNNAAIINRNAPLWQVSAAEFSAVIDTNIKGVANVIRHFVPAMVARRRGVIVNFSSGWGRSTDAQVAPYCATKWAIEGLTQALAQELPPGMAAISLNPGIINTEMLQSCFGGSAAGFPTPEQWAKSAAPFLLKLGASHNGQSLTAPG